MTSKELAEASVIVSRGVIAALEKCSKHAKLTKRFADHVEKLLPNYVVHFVNDSFFLGIEVWEKSYYTDRFTLTWAKPWPGSASEGERWQDKMLYQAQRCDQSDNLFRWAQEETIESEVEAIAREIQALRQRALALYDSLPKPSHPVRGDVHHMGPSYEAQKRHPWLRP
jgi:hypothetical protein